MLSTSSVATQDIPGNSGPIYAIAYNPTWQNWYPTQNTQLGDSDFFTDAFQGLWGTVGGIGRDDLKTIADSGYNELRLYNWSPSRGAPSDDAHLPFLDYANSLKLKVIVPVSDFFLSTQDYAWNASGPGSMPDATFSFTSAPDAIQTDLDQFVKSITLPDGKMSPAVAGFSIGNELDLGIAGNPTAVQAARAEWWVVNLQIKLSDKFGAANIPAHFLTIPISNADQGNAWFAAFPTSSGDTTTTLRCCSNLAAVPPVPYYSPNWTTNVYAGLTVTIVAGTGKGETSTIVSNTKDTLTFSPAFAIAPDTSSQFWISNTTSPVSWYQIFADGTTANERVPTGTVSPQGAAATFGATPITGLGSYSWYTTWFYNSLNMFQIDPQLTNTLNQYNTGNPSSGGTWSDKWPGFKPTVPLLITELGTTRFNITEAQQSTAVLGQAQAVENVMKLSTNNVLGYTIFEFNDEPNKNGDKFATNPEFFFGLEQYNTDQAKFRNGTLKYPADTFKTGDTQWAGGTLPSINYPVYNLIPVKAATGQTLLYELSQIFKQIPKK